MSASAMPSSLKCIACLCIALTAQGCAGIGPEDPPSIVLITIDTLRADHLSTYGYFRQTSPTLDRFAREAMVFEMALTTMATTLPAHASLMTSTRTTTHGLKGNFQHLGVPLDGKEGLRTLSEMLRDLGYQTAAFVSAAPVRTHTGLGRGFETFDQPVERERRADATVDRVVTWIESERTRPYFLWVHLFDPHRPRQPPPPYDEAFAIDAPLFEFLTERAATKTDRFVMTQNNLYDGEILFTDTQIGRIFSALEAQGDWQGTTVVVTADHGEGLGQHDWMDHDRIYNEQLRVPLMIKFPHREGPRDVRAPGVASLIDVVPTLVAALDLPIQDRDRAQLEGADLLAGEPGRPGVFSEQTHRDFLDEQGLRFSLTNREWKYFHRTQAEDELYHLIEDPHETENVLAQHPEIGARMRDEILAILSGSAIGGQSEVDVELDREVVDQLRALGYLGGPSDEGGASAIRGMAVWGHEVREFRPCGSKDALWVVDESQELWQRYRFAVAESELPESGIYVELVGRLGPPPVDGFGAEYPGMITVFEVVEVDLADSGCGDG